MQKTLRKIKLSNIWPVHCCLLLKRKFLIANLVIFERFSLFLPLAACLPCPLARSLRRTKREEQQQRFAVGEYPVPCITQGCRTEEMILTPQGARGTEVTQMQVGMKGQRRGERGQVHHEQQTRPPWMQLCSSVLTSSCAAFLAAGRN